MFSKRSKKRPIAVVLILVLLMTITLTPIAASAATATSVTYTWIDWNTMRISAHGVRDTAGLQNVRFAVWGEEDGQNDIKWFTAAYFPEEDTWRIDVRVRHNWDPEYSPGYTFNEIGQYQIHAYSLNGAGIDSFIGGTTFYVEELT